MAGMTAKIATRGSKLALAQAEWVLGRLRKAFPAKAFELRVVKTAGDAAAKTDTLPPGKGIFVKEIEEALLGGEADLAVHSLKDMPTEQPAGLVIAAVPEREDARDALILKAGKDLGDLPAGAVLGTGSSRRAAQILAARPDLRIEPIRGNLDTRLAKLRGERPAAVAYDGIVVAVAGCRRLGLEGSITAVLEPEVVLPAPGQGALAIETRRDDTAAIELAAVLNDEVTATATTAERACLSALGGGCRTPIAAYAEMRGATLRLRARVASPDGTRTIDAEQAGPPSDPDALGKAVAAMIFEQGADALLQPDP